MSNSPKIYYSVWLNRGGLKQVAYSMLELLDDLNQDYEFVLVLFSKEKFPARKNLYQFDVGSHDHGAESVERISKEVRDQVKIRPGDILIADDTTLRFWSKCNLPYFYDVHLLQRELYTQLRKTSEIHQYDKFMNSKTLVLLLADEMTTFLYEGRALKNAKGFIVNSLCSLEHLKQHYPKEIKDKEIYHIPVYSTAVKHRKYQPPDVSKRTLYNSSRSHPQKGHHFFFSHDWKDTPVYFRGFWPEMFDSEVQAKASKKNIHILEWIDDKEALEQELMNYAFHIFPSIYEPWGLALEESLRAGRICIAHKNNSGHEEQIIHGHNGFLIDFNQVTWRDELNKILAMDKELLINVSKNAYNGQFLGRKERLIGFKKIMRELRENV